MMDRLMASESKQSDGKGYVRQAARRQCLDIASAQPHVTVGQAGLAQVERESPGEASGAAETLFSVVDGVRRKNLAGIVIFVQKTLERQQGQASCRPDVGFQPVPADIGQQEGTAQGEGEDVRLEDREGKVAVLEETGIAGTGLEAPAIVRIGAGTEQRIVQRRLILLEHVPVPVFVQRHPGFGGDSGDGILFGDEFLDFNLVFCSANGRPVESQIINRAFNKLIRENGFPKVVFHSIRHTSITYKLKLNGGDMKSVQGDSGHAQLKMVADVYSHIIDDDRRLNAQRFEETFYSGKGSGNEANETGGQVQAAEARAAEAAQKQETDQEALIRILQNPEMAALLKTLAQSL